MTWPSIALLKGDRSSPRAPSGPTRLHSRPTVIQPILRWQTTPIETSCFRSELAVDRTAERGSLLTSRTLWTYSAAFSAYRDPAYLAMADHAYRDLMLHFHDRENGGFYRSFSADGAILRDRKQVYGQAFAVYALSEYYDASGRPESLDQAFATYRLIEKHAHAPHGGYLEAF